VKTPLVLDARLRDSGVPLAQRIAASLAQEIRQGRLTPGSPVPSSRALAQSLSVHRNTVLGAYRELIQEGYLETEQARGTFVSRKISVVPWTKPTAARRHIELDLPSQSGALPWPIEKRDLPLLGGLPDLREFPTEALSRAYRKSLRSGASLLDYAPPAGHPRLIGSTLEYLRHRRGLVSGADELMVTRGSQQALYLAAKALLGRRSVIAVEAAGYPPAWEAFRLAGAKLVPVPIDREGLVVAKLAELVSKTKVAAVYVTPHHQYPTTVSLSGPRRMELLRLAEKARFVILEDDYDHEFHFEGMPILPIARDDEAGLVVHIGTFSKVFAPGVRLGYALARPELIERMTRIRLSIDRQGDSTLELAVAQMMEDGEFDAHVRRMFRLYEVRRRVFYETLTEELGDVLEFGEARGGLATWVQVRRGISVHHWLKRAREEHVVVQPGSAFLFKTKRDVPYMRLGFSRLNEAEIVEAIRRLKKALPINS
jgi:GntR family transcriptional regulator / MocR family aminotransferase